MTRLTRVLLLGILILGLGLPALAQSGRGTITGIVKDPSGAVVPGADITITEKTDRCRHQDRVDGGGRIPCSLTFLPACIRSRRH